MSSICNSLFFCKYRNSSLSNLLFRTHSNMFTNVNINKETETVSQEQNGIAEIVEIDKVEDVVSQIQDYEQPSQDVVVSVDKTKNMRLENTLTHIIDEYRCPDKPDTLFWCIYIAANGYDEYLQVDRNYGVKELEIKKLVAESIQKNSQLLKASNIKVTKIAIQEILSELLTMQKETSFNCLLAMIAYYKLNVLLIDSSERCYLEYISNTENDTDAESETPTYALYKDTFGKYKLKLSPLSTDWIMEFKSKTTRLESNIKPLRAVSTYKTEELEGLAKKVCSLDPTKKYKKPELYDLISDAIRWK